MKVKKYKVASFSAEAAIVAPLFVIAVLTIIGIFQFIIIQDVIQGSITEVARKISLDAVIECEQPDCNGKMKLDKIKLNQQNLLLESKAKRYFNENKKFISKSHKIEKYIDSNKVRFNKSCVVNNKIYIIIEYEFDFPISLLKNIKINCIQQATHRQFIGKSILDQLDDNLEDEYVYVTEYGEVYHKTPDCSYINVIMYSVSGEQIDQIRNKNGAKYYPCEYCVTHKPLPISICYVTEYGTRYHLSKECSRVERDVKRVSIKTVGGRRPCSKCFN